MSSLDDPQTAFIVNDQRLLGYMTEYLDRSLVFSNLIAAGILMILVSLVFVTTRVFDVTTTILFAYTGILVVYGSTYLRRRTRRRLDRIYGKSRVQSIQQTRNYSALTFREARVQQAEASKRIQDLEFEVLRLRKKLQESDSA